MTTQNNQTNAQQHLLPRMYLEGFAESGKHKRLSVWERASGKVRGGSPRTVAKAGGFFTYTDKDGNMSDELEKLFEVVETGVKPIIYNINSLFPPPITGQYKDDLAQYVAFQHMRTAVKRKEMEQSADMLVKLQTRAMLQSREQISKALESVGHEPSEEAITQVEEVVKNPHKYEIVPSKEMILNAQLKQLPAIAEVLLRRDWHIVTFDEPTLITSDNPVLLKPDDTQPYYWLRGVGLGTAQEIWFPLTSTRLLVLSHPDYTGPRILKGTPQLAQRANEVQLASSYMEAYGLPAIMKHYDGKPLGARPLSEVDSGFDQEFFAHYNKPPDRPRPING